MLSRVIKRSRKALTLVNNRFAPTAAELKARQQVAFSVLHPQVEIMKRSPMAQFAVGTAISGLVLSGNLASAAGLAGAWIFAKPLTHAVAGGVAGVGLIDAKLLAAIERLQSMQFEPAEAIITS
ncbi:MAG: hypothetical protein WCJ35_25065 [Planctomycetota bacterium]